jgi:acyl-coenzyme A synthetase/AMP-(fatty) acid ligase/alpha-beta hydrolase superfamily lysophospholipase
VTAGPVSPATLPPQNLPGLEPEWSRLVTTPALDDAGRTWHILDNGVENPSVTLLCVHGNPTWSYLWRDVVANAPDDVRVIAVDQLDMGFSERTGTVRRLAQRVADLKALTDELALSGPVVTVAHDWGGPISLGWALAHQDQLAGVVLMNTAVYQPEGSRAPTLIRMVRLPGILNVVCEMTPSFVRGTMALSRPRPSKAVRRAYEAPYLTAERRSAIAEFVEDIPLSSDHPSDAALAEIAAGLEQLVDVPSLLLWGPSDPVFSDLYLHDLEERLPNARTHRFVGSSHLVPEDAEVAGAVFEWLEKLDSRGVMPQNEIDRDHLWAALDRRADDDAVAIVEMGSDGEEGSVSFSELHSDAIRVAGGLISLGLRKGDRVAMLVPPGIDLAVSIFACWRIGVVVVLADAGLGVRGMGRALASANPDYLIGIPRALSAARMMRWPGKRISTVDLQPTQQRVLGTVASLNDLRDRGADAQLPEPPGPLDEAGIGFTSGATGPAKGVIYRHRQLQAQRDALISLYGINESDSLVAAFGPFSLLGTLMGIPSVVPDMKVTSPGSLTARALADAADRVEATLVFASPAALRNVASTANELTSSQREALANARLLLSAGAPVPADVLRTAAALMPNAEAHTPYGMTEVMPVADISLTQIDTAGTRDGVCVGQPVDGVDVAISEIDAQGRAVGQLTSESGILGEVCIRAAHMRDGYDKLWVTDNRASQPAGWHRSGDVGHFDADGRLWIEGRIGHVVTTAAGPVTPVGIEHRVAMLGDVHDAAVVGVGPVGTQQVVVVVTPVDQIRRPDLASVNLADRVRSAAGPVDVAAVLTVASLPVDKRHNSKIDRTRIARWAEAVLSGGRMRRI